MLQVQISLHRRAGFHACFRCSNMIDYTTNSPWFCLFKFSGIQYSIIRWLLLHLHSIAITTVYSFLPYTWRRDIKIGHYNILTIYLHYLEYGITVPVIRICIFTMYIFNLSWIIWSYFEAQLSPLSLKLLIQHTFKQWLLPLGFVRHLHSGHLPHKE